MILLNKQNSLLNSSKAHKNTVNVDMEQTNKRRIERMATNDLAVRHARISNWWLKIAPHCKHLNYFIGIKIPNYFTLGYASFQSNHNGWKLKKWKKKQHNPTPNKTKQKPKIKREFNNTCTFGVVYSYIMLLFSKHSCV